MRQGKRNLKEEEEEEGEVPLDKTKIQCSRKWLRMRVKIHLINV